ncbi:hypothetical protein [Achromobacter xylosoxidans]|uniref:hypothetical protein n=1 Tax=Alcaligenes xylosoxydans xylosoxydans TaxID=85698 RepID=UPI0008A45E8B|nr:hypothetical protein [Achromobacter xylosoxidans]OFQ51990.1 hypothetical protein HMPREF2939_08725 [Achromobacter xylosoxidans]
MKKRYQVFLLLVFGVLFAVFAFNPPEESDQWAAWVQAWGSLVAIGAAIWVAKDQHDKAEKRRVDDFNDEVRSFLAGIREELKVTWKVYMVQVGFAVKATEQGQVVDWIWPVPDSPFKVYAATVGSIGRVHEDELRNAIVSTYIVANGLLLTWQMHNAMKSARDSVPQKIYQAEGYRENSNWTALNSELATYSAQLKKHQLEASKRIKKTVRLIDGFLGRTAQSVNGAGADVPKGC